MKCFVMQPFDGGKFDKRYQETYKPAIETAGYEPYRVDSDFGASIPIDKIEESIVTSAACFADISEDNPNVWFELGYAIASRKQICLVCSDERSKFPFDVQHRHIIKYKTESMSDYTALSASIANRLNSIRESESKLMPLRKLVPTSGVVDTLERHEIIVLAALLEAREGPNNEVSYHATRANMEKIGVNNATLNIGLEVLLRRQLIEQRFEYDDMGYSTPLFTLTESGVDWLLQNHRQFDVTS